MSTPRLDCRKPRKPQPANVAAFVGRDVEVHTIGGGLYRGQLTGVDGPWLRLVRHTGFDLMVALSAVTAVLDEQRLPTHERERD